MKTTKHLLVDAKNAIYRALYAVQRDNYAGPRSHPFVILLRNITSWINLYRPESVHVFWDAPRTTVWRRDILATYKDRANNQYIEGLAENLATTQVVAQECFAKMNVRQYSRQRMEADDLIYAACTVLHPLSSTIVSTDSDLLQIPFMFNSSCLYNPQDRDEVGLPEYNPAVQKAIVGDTTDTIPGYYGIGPKTVIPLMKSPAALAKHMETAGREIFVRNLKLVDLSACPDLLVNQLYVRKKLAQPLTFERTELMNLCDKYKINGLRQSFTDLVMPFKALV